MTGVQTCALPISKWTDLCSFDPRFPAELQLVIKRFERDDAYIATLEKEVIKFLGELDDKLNKVKELRG